MKFKIKATLFFQTKNDLTPNGRKCMNQNPKIQKLQCKY
jgi:hypothetical protein